MSQAIVSINSTMTAAQGGQVFSHKDVVLTDSAGGTQAQKVDGITQVSATFDTTSNAPGTASVTVTDMDTTGVQMVGSTPQTATFTIAAPAMFPATTSVTVVVG